MFGRLFARRAYSTSPTAHPLTAQLRAALKASMLGRTPKRTGVIKSILADLQTASHMGSSPPSPYKTLAVSISKRLDAVETFRSSSPPRLDLADQYTEEIEILKEFAPKRPEPMTKEQLEEVVREVMKMCELEKVVGRDTGRVIKLTMERVGERAEGKDISAAVKRVGSA
ncbi:uncharacterized protein JCM6883_000561 [Sporobolomyces salmoneus]|uniref:uncharacterized protein n=1 Tax=Sporobolomyces salmoneus TaxID=183962 RepID=UPI0031799FE5